VDFFPTEDPEAFSRGTDPERIVYRVFTARIGAVVPLFAPPLRELRHPAGKPTGSSSEIPEEMNGSLHFSGTGRLGLVCDMSGRPDQPPPPDDLIIKNRDPEGYHRCAKCL
jgi:hypothetical protein